MSWAEIKKAVNSDLDVPLNELIKEQAHKPFQNENIKVFTQDNYSSTPVSNKTIFSLTGKARLYGIVAYGGSGSSNCKMLPYLYFDNHRFCLTPTGTYASYTGISNIICQSDNWRVLESISGSAYFGYILYMPKIMGCLTKLQAQRLQATNYNESAPIYTPQQFLYMTEAPLGSVDRSIVISEPIEVENNFKMIVSTQNGDYTNYVVVYELLE